MKINNFLKFLISIIICQLAGAIGAVVTYPSIKGWYNSIQKPSFNPPNWIFGPAWTILYILMGLSLFFVWKTSSKKNNIKPEIFIFTIQLILNIAWSFLFFGLHNPFIAFLGIITLWIFIVLTIYKFQEINKLSALLLIPYLLWVTFAAFLNFSIWRLNI